MAEFVADLVAEPNSISDMTERAMAYLADSGVDARTAHHVALVLDELLTNVVTHSGSEKAPAMVRLSVAPDRVNAQLFDGAAAFDPRLARDVDVSTGLADRPIGGVGLLHVHRMTDGLDYERIGDRNKTTFWICRRDETV